MTAFYPYSEVPQQVHPFYIGLSVKRYTDFYDIISNLYRRQRYSFHTIIHKVSHRFFSNMHSIQHYFRLISLFQSQTDTGRCHFTVHSKPKIKFVPCYFGLLIYPWLCQCFCTKRISQPLSEKIIYPQQLFLGLPGFSVKGLFCRVEKQDVRLIRIVRYGLRQHIRDHGFSVLRAADISVPAVPSLFIPGCRDILQSI